MADYFNEIFNYKEVKLKLIKVALFITVYEIFKKVIIEEVKDYAAPAYNIGEKIDINQTYDNDKYEKEVLNKVPLGAKAREIKASILWLKEQNAIDGNDQKICKDIADLRNNLVHNITSSYLVTGLPTKINELYKQMLSLLDKILKWFYCEYEDYDNHNSDEVKNGLISVLSLLTEIALSENEEELEKMHRNIQDIQKIFQTGSQ